METNEFKNIEEKVLNNENSYNYRKNYDSVSFSNGHKNNRYKRKASFKKVLANTVAVFIIISLLSAKFFIPWILNDQPEIADCLAYGSSHESSYDNEKIEQSLKDNGFFIDSYDSNEIPTILSGSKRVGEEQVEFYFQGTNSSGHCTISIKKEFEVEIENQTLHFSVEVRNSSEDIDAYLIRYQLGEDQYDNNVLYNTNVQKDFNEDDIIFFQEFDNETINEYYNYQYLRDTVDVLSSEVESLKKGD